MENNNKLTSMLYITVNADNAELTVHSSYEDALGQNGDCPCILYEVPEAETIIVSLKELHGLVYVSELLERRYEPKAFV